MKSLYIYYFPIKMDWKDYVMEEISELYIKDKINLLKFYNCFTDIFV